ncbi:MAG: hypothetical protein FJ304_05705 [Planctomycetes bacterium]|nr:hypothetical protein [Planctomycetota bacterium]
MSEFQVVFSGVIAYILLALYAGLVGYMTYMVAKHKTADFPSGITITATTVGGLVSALVVAQLATAKPNQPPALPTLEAKAKGENPSSINVGLTIAYMVVWLVTGLSALIVGVIIRSGVNKTLAAIGTTWLGLAVATAYAFFGLKP